MNSELFSFARTELASAPPPPIIELAQRLASERGAIAAVFYGSNLRTGSLEGVIDFYLLTARSHRRGLRALAEKWLWPEVSYHEVDLNGTHLRVKAATMPLSVFQDAATGAKLDTTIWSRFSQPSALIWSADATRAIEVETSIAIAMETAARFAAALGPESGKAAEYWNALFDATYRAELRVEAPGRAQQIIEGNLARYETILKLAWASGGISFNSDNDILRPQLPVRQRTEIIRAWRRRQSWGRSLNAARLVKAAFTFEGAARYALWKIERHTGVRIPLTPWRERHPILAAPEIMWRVWRARQSNAR